MKFKGTNDHKHNILTYEERWKKEKVDTEDNSN